jgi:hypothetical protein
LSEEFVMITPFFLSTLTLFSVLFLNITLTESALFKICSSLIINHVKLYSPTSIAVPPDDPRVIGLELSIFLPPEFASDFKFPF